MSAVTKENRTQLEESIRWHLDRGYRVKRTAEILEDRGATTSIVQCVYDAMEAERAELAKK
ncbi:hypothetical protein [Leptospira stimsonii]|uniref:hypothetical protein n=1 Tax=Leptospira stimsonii TaxID=2202203 RepID=UPI001082F6C0|nr:hypothetical protein [Leptospira stimsonii]TGK12831.1 hypothetical protein EHO98_19525 [Leptospira stimsonii]